MSTVIQDSSMKNLVEDSIMIVESVQQAAYRAVNKALVLRNWLLGQRISQENMGGDRPERYGERIIENLSTELTERFGKGFDKRSLYKYVQFYRTYSEIVPSLSTQSSTGEIVLPVRAQSLLRDGAINAPLSWTHYRALMQVTDPEARKWYEQEAYSQTWSARTLQRNIDTQYYERMLISKNKAPVVKEMKQKTSSLQEKASFIKSPYVLEFLGLPEDPSVTESKLESSILSNLQKFIMEMGKGFAFIARQQHIHTEK